VAQFDDSKSNGNEVSFRVVLVSGSPFVARTIVYYFSSELLGPFTERDSYQHQMDFRHQTGSLPTLKVELMPDMVAQSRQI
jgi:hypothetical protein